MLYIAPLYMQGISYESLTSIEKCINDKRFFFLFLVFVNVRHYDIHWNYYADDDDGRV